VPIVCQARQPLWNAERYLHPPAVAPQKAWMKVHKKRLLDQGKIERLVGALRALASQHPALGEKIQNKADYFDRNKHPDALPQVPPPAPVCRFRRH
jgi:hypothetical protein